jgi:hypothetical protein
MLSEWLDESYSAIAPKKLASALQTPPAKPPRTKPKPKPKAKTKPKTKKL